MSALKCGLKIWLRLILAGLLALAAPSAAGALTNHGEYFPHGWQKPNLMGALKISDRMIDFDPSVEGEETRREEFILPDEAGRVLRLSHNGRVFAYVVDHDLNDPWDYQIVDYDGSGGFEMKELAFSDFPLPRWTFINHPFLSLRTADYTVKDPSLKELIDSLAGPKTRPCRKRFTPEQRAALAVARGGVQPPDECLPEPYSTVSAAAAGEAPRVALNIQFEFDSDELTGRSRSILDLLGRAMTAPELAGNVFRLEGHTDAVGGHVYNLDLSHRRALAVQRYLLANFNLSSGQLRAQGYGFTVPLPNLEPIDGRNRRVEVVNLSGGQSLTIPGAAYQDLPPEYTHRRNW
ncbi:MAG: OmpA family protein [Candidatus Adiutrix sp.]|jgi:outer membrane protein OmpA-like peptidoglycan-associated protein|nr:OmpA family protein [Candidatus Adiutrix sp.]